MSRGPGILQRAIRKRLTAGEVQANQLCWELARQLGGTGESQGDLTRPFYASFRRALGSDQALRMNKRRLEDLDDLEKYYPFKTRDASLKCAREVLLPVLCAHLDRTKQRQFGRSENEDYLLTLVPQETRRALRASWRRIEPEVIRAMDNRLGGDAEHRDRLLDVLVRGRDLFCPDSEMSHARAFGRILAAAEAAVGALPVLLDARRLYVEALPKDQLRRVALKSRLFAVVNFSKQGSSSMKDETKKMLLSEAPRIVKALPGHVERTGQRWFHYPVEFSPVLDRLIGRDVLGPFEFVTLAA